MNRIPHWQRGALRTLWITLLMLLAACGGGNDPAPPQQPTARITAPAEGALFRAGDTLTFSGDATDGAGTALPAAALTWWADLHHDTHTHPLTQPSAGASGSVTIPTRGETSDNIFYRFHLRATDSRGQSVEVTRDVLPRKSQVTLATQPAGLGLTLDGQPVVAPSAFTGVVGTLRDLGAPDQEFAGRRYRFAAWSQGGPATQTVSTPDANTTYTATFTDTGPVNNAAPTVTLGAPATGAVGVALDLVATAADSDGSVAKVEFFDGAALIGTDTTSPYRLSWTPSTSGSRSLTARATDNLGLAATSAAVTITVDPAPGADTQPPTAALTTPANLADVLSGTLTVSATVSDNVAVVGVEFQIDGVAIGAEDTTAPYQASLDTTLHASGQHVIRARARDAAGNRSAWSTSTVRFAGSRAVPAGFSKSDNWVPGLSSATAFAQAGDGRLFIAEQGGALRVVKNGALLATPFLQLPVDSNGERGLIGVALHPGFASNGFVYVYYTATTPSTHNRISRFVADAAAGGDVSTGAETVLVDLPALSGATNHNGGAMKFGADGKLVVAVGDNANSAKSQNLADVFGKMLRFNDDGGIPADNPYYTTQSGQARSIWARGLRNPFTFAIQPGTGRMHINDVGQGTWEEVNLGAAGANYGWPASEGPDNVSAGMTAPLFTYKHSAAVPAGSGPGGFFTGFAIAGGAFYPASGGTFPAAYRGNYFFADYVSKFVGLLDLANDNAAYAFASLQGSPVDVLVGTDGALLVLTRSAVTRITPP